MAGLNQPKARVWNHGLVGLPLVTFTANSQINYTLDQNGDLTSDGLRLFEYDGQNRLATVKVSQSAEASKISYLHNALGQRVFKSEPQVAQTAPDEATLGLTFVDWLKKNFGWLFAQAQANATLGQSYIYSDDNLGSTPVLLGEYGNGGNKSAGRIEYIYLPTEDGQTMPIGLMKANRFYAIQADHLNTPRLIRDDSHKPVWQWAYSAFGDNKPSGLLKATPNPKAAITNQPVLLKATNPLEINLRYPGQYFDEESNLNYNYFRTYQPTQGRYTQSDPIGLDGGLNRFSYVEGNPLLYTDPLGLDLWCKDRSLNIRVPMPPGRGGGCGDSNTDKYIPDTYPEACYAHDSCYANPGPSRSQCDRRFLRDMITESGPEPNILGPLIYYGGVRLFGGDAFRRARQ